VASKNRNRCERCGKSFPKKKLTFTDNRWRCEACANNVHNRVHRGGNTVARLASGATQGNPKSPAVRS
jgi:hypothetical protein